MTQIPEKARAEALEKLRTNPTLKAAWGKIADAVDDAYYKIDDLLSRVDEWFEPSEPKPEGWRTFADVLFGPKNPYGSSSWEKTLRETIDAARKRAEEQAKSAKQTNPVSGTQAFLDAYKKAAEETRKKNQTREQEVPLSGGLFTPCRICFLSERYHTPDAVSGAMGKHDYQPLTKGF